MFHFLGFLFIIIIAVLIIGISIVGGVLRAVFGFGRRSTSNPNTYSTSGRRQQQSARREREEEERYNAEENIQPRKHKKIFDKDEGEYVEFEEIKE